MPAVALAYVNRGRWVVLCPYLCGGALLAESDSFLCPLCGNGGTNRPVPLVWPSAEDRSSIEAALAVRPPLAQNWNVDETIGFLLVENVEHGLYDPTSGTVDGDTGADHFRAPALLALAGARRELGA